MLRTALFFFAVAGGLEWLAYGDRRSTLALHVVEWSDFLPVPLFSVAVMLGVVFVLLHVRSADDPRSTRAARRPSRRTRPAPLRMEDGSGHLGFRDGVVRRARNLPLEAGARLELDPAVGVPMRLVLEQMPPGRSKRAIGRFAEFLASLPPVPRVQVAFIDCPAPQSPLHVFVQGALAHHLPRNSFKVVRHVDRIDVMFFEHDRVWREEW